jgi:hypothetical protein
LLRRGSKPIIPGVDGRLEAFTAEGAETQRPQRRSTASASPEAFGSAASASLRPLR